MGSEGVVGEENERSLNHFAAFQFKQAFWDLDREPRQQLLKRMEEGLFGGGHEVGLYQVYPAEAGIDFLLWTASPLKEADNTAAFMRSYASATIALRRWIHPVQVLWGYTGKSTYSRARSAQEIDPFAEHRCTYLVIYPFAKTGDWYLMGQDARQGMMNEHIRLGKGYPEIKQLLLYSFGLQDQEFVVVYEMEDLPQFSELVHELRATEARRYTRLDTPLIAGVHRTQGEWLGLWQEPAP